MKNREVLTNLLKLMRTQQRRIHLLEQFQFAAIALLHRHAPDVYKDLSRAVEFSEDFSRHPENYLPPSEDPRFFRAVVEASSEQLGQKIDAHDESLTWINDALKQLGEEPTKNSSN